MKNKKIYVVVNTIVIITIIGFIISYWNNIFSLDFKNIILAIIPFICIHLLRIIRQYIILMENKIKMKKLTRAYLFSSITNTIIPFKIGEIYKIYLYGYEMNNYKKSVIAVLIDKFFDAIFLLIAFIIIEIVNKQETSLITILLLIFVFLVIITYVSFEKTYKFLNKYLIINKNTKFSNKCLKILEEIKDIFIDVKNMINNREILIIILTILSWMFEICFAFIICKSINLNLSLISFITYINDSFFGMQNGLSNYYIYVTSIIFIIYIAIITINKGGKNEKNSISI